MPLAQCTPRNFQVQVLTIMDKRTITLAGMPGQPGQPRYAQQPGSRSGPRCRLPCASLAWPAPYSIEAGGITAVHVTGTAMLALGTCTGACRPFMTWPRPGSRMWGVLGFRVLCSAQMLGSLAPGASLLWGRR